MRNVSIMDKWSNIYNYLVRNNECRDLGHKLVFSYENHCRRCGKKVNG